MAAICEIHPRTDLSTDDCKALGDAVFQWLYADPSNREAGWFGMNDLRAGELPQPWYIQRIMGIEGRTLPEEDIGKPGTPKVHRLSDTEREEFRQRLGDKAMSRHVELVMRGKRSQDRAFVIASLREMIPAGTVNDVLIDGSSWDE
jgi:hypothetical protein